MTNTNDVMMKHLEILDKVIDSNSGNKVNQKQVDNYKIGDIVYKVDNICPGDDYLLCDGFLFDFNFYSELNIILNGCTPLIICQIGSYYIKAR